MGRRQRVMLFIILGLLLFLAVLIGRFLSEPSKTIDQDRETPSTRFINPHFVGYHKSVRQWSLQADAVKEESGREGDGAVRLTNITHGVLYKEGDPHMTFEANTGVWSRTSGDLELEGDVRFARDGSLFFRSQRVVWAAEEERLTSPSRVYLNHEGQALVADRLEAYLKDDRVELHENVVWTTDEGLLVKAAQAVYEDDVLHFIDLDGPARLILGEEEAQ